MLAEKWTAKPGGLLGKRTGCKSCQLESGMLKKQYASVFFYTPFILIRQMEKNKWGIEKMYPDNNIVSLKHEKDKRSR